MFFVLVQLPNGKIADIQEDVSLPSKPMSVRLHDTLTRRKMPNKYVSNRRKGRDDSDSFAPAPLNGGDGGNDSPSAGAETILVKRKRQKVGEFI